MVAVAVPVGQEKAAAERLAGLPGVAYAELDYGAVAQVIPSDPDFSKQWALTQIGAPSAWDATTNSCRTIIAILDTGADLNHPDLAGRLWVNKGEVPANGKDDDGNGMIDDVRGWRFYHAYVGAGYEPRGDGPVMDDNGHGTHITCIAAAATNDGIGVAGVTWNSPAMIVKVLDKSGTGWYSDIAAGILYAANNGAGVINLSLGGTEPSESLCSAVGEAAGLGTFVAAAAGNHGSRVLYPAACTGAVAVGATDRSDQPASFTNPGPQVDLAAPGVDILSTWYLTGFRPEFVPVRVGYV